MNLFDWLPGRARQRNLRRFSPERAKLAARERRDAPIAQGGEKVFVGAVAGALAALLLGTGSGLDARGWTGLFALLAIGGVFFTRYLVDFRAAGIRTIGRVVALAAVLLAPLVFARLIGTFVGERELAFLPLSLVALIIALAWNRAFALDCTVVTGGLLGLYVLLRPDSALAFPGLIIALSGAFVAAIAAGGVRRRGTVVRIGVLVGLVQLLVAGALVLLEAGGPPDTSPWGWLVLLGLEGVAVGLIVTGGLPLLESAFGVTTDISLLELGNTHEQPLLRKLLLEAPGTFHHSYIVGLISEAATEAVGGNALLARVGALYHDIGKMNKPAYFAENSPDARAKHKDLTPEMSTLIIAAHPRDGVELGRYYGLPQAILDFMPEHHGTSCIEYFFHAAKKLRGEENVREEAFRYPGPRPQRVETAIVMIADAVEAISRQMPDPTRARLTEMVHKVAMKRLMDRQFDECPMTLRDLERIEEACVGVLTGIYHTRPTFPKGKPHPLDLSQPSARGEEGAVGTAVVEPQRPPGASRAESR